MKKTKINGLEYYQSPAFDNSPAVHSGFFTRNGGRSIGTYSSLNVGISVGDDPDTVSGNRKAVLSAVNGSHLVTVNQVHGTEVAVIRKGDLPDPFTKADAMITNVSRLALMIQTADCQAVFLYDPENKVIGNVHSGWRGSVENIIGKTVRAMSDTFGSRPEQLIAAIGPSLGPCCAEFVNYRKELPEDMWKYRQTSDYFDFWALSADQLKFEGVHERNIFRSGLCTKCNQDLFFSYRRDKVTGRLANIICLT